MQYDDISMLPPRYQEQVRRKLAGKTNQESAISRWQRMAPQKEQPETVAGETDQEPGEKSGRKTKYGNRETEVTGIKFDSKKEARRFLELREMEQCGAISDLRLQVNFTLIEGFTKPSGERVKPEIYKADFAYKKKDQNGAYTIYIVEDVKSRATKTEKYRIKKKQMWEKFHIEVQEV